MNVKDMKALARPFAEKIPIHVNMLLEGDQWSILERDEAQFARFLHDLDGYPELFQWDGNVQDIRQAVMPDGSHDKDSARRTVWESHCEMERFRTERAVVEKGPDEIRLLVVNLDLPGGYNGEFKSTFDGRITLITRSVSVRKLDTDQRTLLLGFVIPDKVDLVKITGTDDALSEAIHIFSKDALLWKAIQEKRIAFVGLKHGESFQVRPLGKGTYVKTVNDREAILHYLTRDYPEGTSLW